MSPINKVAYEETNHYRITKSFLNRHDMMLKELLDVRNALESGGLSDPSLDDIKHVEFFVTKDARLKITYTSPDDVPVTLTLKIR